MITDSVIAFTDLGFDTAYCYSYDSVTMLQPLPITADTFLSNYNEYNISCYGFNNGSISLQLSGGVAPYNNKWSTGNGSGLVPLSKNQTELTAGSYTDSIYYGQNCSAAITIVLTQPDSLTLNPVLSNYNGYSIACYGNSDGQITTNVSGGVKGYVYLWDVLTGNSVPISGAANQAALESGKILLIIKNSNGCEKPVVFDLTEPPQLTGTLTLENITCFADNDGKASISVSGGIAPYSFSWSTGDTTKSIVNLTNGNYTLMITDNDQCKQNYTFNIIRPQLLIAEIQIKSNYNGRNISCAGDTDGILNALAKGGRPPYTYLWSNGSNQKTIKDLSTGIFYLQVQDSSNCIADTSVVLAEPEPVTLYVSGIMPKCFGYQDGEASANASGGTQPYDYAWSNGATTSQINNIMSGYYKIKVSDLNKCKVDTVFYLAEPLKLTVDLKLIQPNCPEVANGSIISEPTGGTPPYTYEWSNNSTGAEISVCILVNIP